MKAKRRRGRRRLPDNRPPHPLLTEARHARSEEGYLERAYPGLVDWPEADDDPPGPNPLQWVPCPWKSWLALDPAPPMVYIVGTEDASILKIGYTVDLRGRLRTHRCGSPVRLELHALILGDRRSERWLHNRFADCHSHGEWFTGPLMPALLALANETSRRQHHLAVAKPYVDHDMAHIIMRATFEGAEL